MKLLRLAFIAVSILLFSCKNSSDSFSKYLNPEALPTQTFEFNINRDTTLVTKGNCIIKIPAGSIESDQPNVKLDIKEALNNTDIVLAGLTTMSGDQVLNSGGMIKIDATEGYKATIRKPLEALIPTKDYNADMSVYKGVEKDGKIDWVDPEPLPNDSLQMIIKKGKALFTANCASCHKIDKDFTAPAMKGITQRRPLSWIYNFTRNPTGMIGHDPYSKQLATKWKPTVMTAFPEFKNDAIYAILAYIETNGGMKGFDFIKLLESQTACADSCEKYINALNENQYLENEINNTTEDFFTLDMTIPVPLQKRSSSNMQTDTLSSTDSFTVTERSAVKATFYTVNIKTFGWVNVDIMADQNKCEPSKLLANVKGKYETGVQVMLIIPSVKLFVKAEKNESTGLYVFKEDNGNIPLPQNVPCYIIAFAESGEKLVFGKNKFVSALNQTIDISMTETTKQGLTDQITALKLDGIKTDADDSKAVKKQLVDKSKIDAEKLRPKNCDCGILPASPAPAIDVKLYNDAVFEDLLSKDDSLTESPGTP